MKLASMVSAIAIATGVAAVGWAGESTGGLALGSKVPAAVAKTKMKNVDGKMLSLADVTGKAGTLVVFTCNHCPFAKDWEQRIVELGNAYAGKGIGVVLVNANDPTQHADDGFEEMQAHAKSRGMKIPYVVDETSAVARAFGASITPEAFLFDKTGKLAYHGTIDDNRKEPDKVKARYLKDALDAVVAGKAPAVSETKGLGCGIKFRS
ncbi:MAG TPA: thioredoxin family protein [Polyangia bacterium]|nr:thioredoxin family protein [Polyangia bacterium]